MIERMIRFVRAIYLISKSIAETIVSIAEKNFYVKLSAGDLNLLIKVIRFPKPNLIKPKLRTRSKLSANMTRIEATKANIISKF